MPVNQHTGCRERSRHAECDERKLVILKAERISANGRVVKASYDVKVGDRLEIALGGRTLAVEVLQVAETVRKDDAAAMYREV